MARRELYYIMATIGGYEFPELMHTVWEGREPMTRQAAWDLMEGYLDEDDILELWYGRIHSIDGRRIHVGCRKEG
jgi:hypothetical protein